MDFTYKQTRLFLFLHMALVTFVFMAPMLAIMGLYKVGEVKLITHTGKSLLGSTEVSVQCTLLHDKAFFNFDKKCSTASMVVPNVKGDALEKGDTISHKINV